MKKGARLRGAGLVIWLLLFSLIWLAVLEFNKNTPTGWVQTVGVLVVYAILRRRWLGRFKWPVRLGALALCLVLLALIFVKTQGPYQARPAVSGEDPRETGPVAVTGGRISGVLTEDGAVEVYAGVPYAKPPLGELRWQPPQDVEPWSGVRKADKFAPMAMQPVHSNLYNSLAQVIGYHDYEISLKDNFRDLVSEDALYLNIWKPAGEVEGLPVLVYIHGGSLQTGQPWYADYSGEGLARKNVIVVNMGYRLGVFGFLATEELLEEAGSAGNYGLMDQIKALEWVRDNIEAFGGDPEKVTLAGESAGSACVSALCVSPRAKGLFRYAIGESSTVSAPEPTHSYCLLDEALELGRQTMERFGVTTLEELRALPAEKLVAAADRVHQITIDGAVLNNTPYEALAKGENNAEAVLHGFNAQEGTAFILFDNANLKNYEEKVRLMYGEEADEVLRLYPVSTDEEAKNTWIDLYSAYFFSYGHYCWARQLQSLGVPGYEYYFSKSNGRLGAWHSGEEVYFYNNIPANSRLYDEADRALSDRMSDYFVNFITNGDPNGPGLPHWQADTVGKTLLELGGETLMREDPYLPLYPIQDRLQNA